MKGRSVRTADSKVSAESRTVLPAELRERLGVRPGDRLRYAREHHQAGRSQEGRMMRYAIVIEQAGSNVSAYVPDLPGCIATAPSVEAVEREIRDAIRFHIEGLRADGEPVPEPTSLAEYVDA